MDKIKEQISNFLKFIANFSTLETKEKIKGIGLYTVILFLGYLVLRGVFTFFSNISGWGVVFTIGISIYFCVFNNWKFWKKGLTIVGCCILIGLLFSTDDDNSNYSKKIKPYDVEAPHIQTSEKQRNNNNYNQYEPITFENRINAWGYIKDNTFSSSDGMKLSFESDCVRINGHVFGSYWEVIDYGKYTATGKFTSTALMRERYFRVDTRTGTLIFDTGEVFKRNKPISFY